MEELFAILKEQTIVLEKIGFCQTSYSEPKGMSFGMSWYHDILDIHFAVVWDRMDMFVISCNVNELKHYKPFFRTLEEWDISYDINLLHYSLSPENQFNKELFSNVLDYNLKKLRELIIVLE